MTTTDNQMSDDVVLVTGSSGCLGRQVVKLLISNDAATREIRCLDLVEPSEEMLRDNELELDKVNGSANNKAQSVSKKKIQYFQGDIRDINLVESILEDLQVTCIIHCASKIDIWTERRRQNEDELESINVSGTETLLKSCVRFAVHKFVHVSSFEVFSSYHTIYYATESTVPEPDNLLFGPSGRSKKLAEDKVRQYANNKLRPYRLPKRTFNGDNDYLNAVILRFTPFYGENERYFASRFLKIAKLFSGRLQKFSNIWIRQQPIYVGNAAWALICAKNKMNSDASISGEGESRSDGLVHDDSMEEIDQIRN